MRPLSGIRVIEAASYVTGPFAALALADLGADVVKVEPPRGDPMRRFGIRHGTDGPGCSFTTINRNKSGRVLDLKTDAGREELEALVAGADVFVTNWRPAVAERLGLADLRERHPRLVWVRVSGYGQDGPHADLPAFDSILQARSGVVAHNGEVPTIVPGYLADKVTAMLAVQAVLATLLRRAATGEGALVDVSMLDAMTYFAGPDLLSGHTVLGAPERAVPRHLAAVRPLATSDGWLVTSPVSGRQLKGALAALGRPEWAEDLKGAATPTEMIELFYSLAEKVLPSRTSAEWEAAFRAADVPASAVLDVDALLADPQLVHNAMFHEADDPLLGRVRRLRHPALFDEMPADGDDLPAPALGERRDDHEGRDADAPGRS